MRLIRAEISKLMTTRTPWVLLGAAVVTTILAVTAAILVSSGANLDLESDTGVRTVLHVSASGAVFMLVLGVIITAGEYRQRTATDTFLTTPQRWRVTLAKVVVATGVGAVFGFLCAGAAMAAANHIYTLKGYTFPLGSSLALPILGGAILYAALFGAIGAATGSLLRNQVGAIVGWLAWLFVVESIMVGIAPAIGRWLPSAAGRSLVRDPEGTLLSQPKAALVLLAYGAIIAVSAIVVERYRDA